MTDDQLYVDIAAVRIQSYLSRTPQLKGRRGASAALAEATRVAPGHALLQCAPGVQINPDAGEADGVVNLVAPSDTDPEALCRTVFGYLRRQLPAAQFQAVWGRGSSYLETHHAVLGPRLRDEDVLRDLPPVPEFPYAANCRLCDQDPATTKVWLDAHDSRDACADCSVRFRRQIRQAGEGAERELSRALGTSRTAEHFTALALMGERHSGRNHLATVFIDGNAFGEFFRHLADPAHKVDPLTKSRVSGALNMHTREALAKAVQHVRRNGDGDALCAIPHVVGGDDVLVSLPADRGWPFVLHYLDTFATLVEGTRREAGLASLPKLTASAGIVFARAKHPFHFVAEDAAARLTAAKSAVRGQECSVAFQDLTTGETGEALRLETLIKFGPALDRLARAPKSFRMNLASALRHDHARPTEHQAEDRVRNTAARLGCAELVEPFVNGSALPPEQALRILRWWR